MTSHHRRLLDLYTDYLPASFGATTATGLARLVPEVSHDQITRLLSRETLTDKDLWQIVKPHVRAVESPEAVLIIDDSVEEKRYSDESELITWHYDHNVGRTVKGVKTNRQRRQPAFRAVFALYSRCIRAVFALYYSQGVSLPVAFELIRKTVLETDPKTGKDKWVSPKTKNEITRWRVRWWQRSKTSISPSIMCWRTSGFPRLIIWSLSSKRPRRTLSSLSKAIVKWP